MGRCTTLGKAIVPRLVRCAIHSRVLPRGQHDWGRVLHPRGTGMRSCGDTRQANRMKTRPEQSTVAPGRLQWASCPTRVDFGPDSSRLSPVGSAFCPCREGAHGLAALAEALPPGTCARGYWVRSVRDERDERMPGSVWQGGQTNGGNYGDPGMHPAAQAV